MINFPPKVEPSKTYNAPIAITTLVISGRDSNVYFSHGGRRCHDFELTVVSDFPELKAKAVLLKQLFTNIIDNSVKFAHPERPLKVEISFVRKGDFLQIIIAEYAKNERF